MGNMSRVLTRPLFDLIIPLALTLYSSQQGMHFFLGAHWRFESIFRTVWDWIRAHGVQCIEGVLFSLFLS
jgi:hypothetical protein